MKLISLTTMRSGAKKMA